MWIFADTMQTNLEILSSIRQGNDTCTLQSVCVPVPIENPDPGVLVFPRCYEMMQCVGSCCDSIESCHATAVQYLQKPVPSLPVLPPISIRCYLPSEINLIHELKHKSLISIEEIGSRIALLKENKSFKKERKESWNNLATTTKKWKTRADFRKQGWKTWATDIWSVEVQRRKIQGLKNVPWIPRKEAIWTRTFSVSVVFCRSLKWFTQDRIDSWSTRHWISQWNNIKHVAAEIAPSRECNPNVNLVVWSERAAHVNVGIKSRNITAKVSDRAIPTKFSALRKNAENQVLTFFLYLTLCPLRGWQCYIFSNTLRDTHSHLSQVCATFITAMIVHLYMSHPFVSFPCLWLVKQRKLLRT